MLVAQTYDTEHGRVLLAFAYVNGGIVTKCLQISGIKHKFETSVELDHILVPVKGTQLGLPFIPSLVSWLECSAAVQAALAKVNWGVIEVLLLDHARIEFEGDGERLEREMLKLAEEHRRLLWTQGTLDTLLSDRKVKESLDLLQDYFLQRRS